MKFVTKPYDSKNDFTFGMLLHYFFENQLRFHKIKASLNLNTTQFRLSRVQKLTCIAK